MSRKDELLKLAQLFHLQARLTLDRSAKQVLGNLAIITKTRRKSCKGRFRRIALV
jgi:hypothetical protein